MVQFYNRQSEPTVYHRDWFQSGHFTTEETISGRTKYFSFLSRSKDGNSEDIRYIV